MYGNPGQKLVATTFKHMYMQLSFVFKQNWIVGGFFISDLRQKPNNLQNFIKQLQTQLAAGIPFGGFNFTH
jgi:hypothetical protein